MYRNFICYRGGSSAGSFFGESIYLAAKKEEEVVGKTYFSLYKENSDEIRNFLNDPKQYLGEIRNFIMILTKGFLDEFLKNGEPNPNSVTRIELEEALKNEHLRFIPIQFADFSWNDTTDGIVNKDILVKLYGQEGADRIIGSPAINFSSNLKDEIINRVVTELDEKGIIKLRGMKDIVYKLESTPSVTPKPVFCGKDELNRIGELFSNGDRIIFLQGIGGIGKTEIAKQYAKKHKADFDTIIYATYTNSVVELVSSQNYFKLSPNFPRLILKDGSQESDIDYFKRKLDEIKNFASDRTLIIIDNFDVMDDEYFKLLVDGRYKMIITTRCDYSRFYPVIKVEPLDNIEQLKNIFLDNYQGYIVDADDPDLEQLINLVNRHTYTIELLAQHMENSCQTVQEMIEVLKERGIVSLDEKVRSTSDSTQVAYENLLKMFKVFDLSDDDKHVLKILSLMPLGGVNAKDLKNWIGTDGLKTVKNLENRSWVTNTPSGIALHPIIREVVRHELHISEDDLEAFLIAFHETIKEEKSWHYVMDVRSYYADITAEIIKILNDINDKTIQLYKDAELLFSFGVRPSQAVELGTKLYKYFENKDGHGCYECAYYSFQIGWTYLFNMQLPDAINNADKWFMLSLDTFGKLTLTKEDEFAFYGHLLTHVCRINLIKYTNTGDFSLFDKAIKYGEIALDNALTHFDRNSKYYSRQAVAHMQLSEAYVTNKEFDKALDDINKSYDIIVSLFGEEDSDTLNVCSRKALILYNLDRFEEALDLSKKNLILYDRYFGKMNYLRFEQLMTAYRCAKKLGLAEESKKLQEEAIQVADQLLTSDSPIFKELND